MHNDLSAFIDHKRAQIASLEEIDTDLAHDAIERLSDEIDALQKAAEHGAGDDQVVAPAPAPVLPAAVLRSKALPAGKRHARR